MINLSLLDILFIFCEEHRNLRDITAEVMRCDDNGLLKELCIGRKFGKISHNLQPLKKNRDVGYLLLRALTPYRHAADLIIY